MREMAGGRAPAILAVVALTASLSSCGIRDGYVRAKQVRTFADLQAMSARIDGTISKSRGTIEASQAMEIVRAINRGRDAWGNEILFYSGIRDGKFSYVLVSPGEDGKLDLGNLDEYLSMPASKGQGRGEQDIVFRDGQPVTMAGK